jgi:TonB-dependent receptor
MQGLKPYGAAALFLALAVTAGAQGPTEARRATTLIRGQVTDTAGHPLQGAIVYVDQRHGTASDPDGNFVIADLTAGRYTLHTRSVGFAADSQSVDAQGDRQAQVAVRLTPITTALSTVRIEERRLRGEALALTRQRSADNLITAHTAEQIEALPNQNAAEAFSRLPGVSLQRHEGDGSALQIRGIDGNLTNLTINGAHMSGKSEDNTPGDRRVYLDGVPANLLGAVIINKTLRPDMDADAIGGSAAIETKSADAAPGFRLATNTGRSDLQNSPVWLGSASWGKRFDDRHALFVGYSIDRNLRVYDDVEPKYARIKVASTGDSATVPTTTSAREYWTDRLRMGGAARYDWKPDDNTTLAFSALVGEFNDFAVRYRQDHTLSATKITPGSDFAGTGTGMAVTSNVQHRKPIDETKAYGIRGITLNGANVLDYDLTWSSDLFQRTDQRDITFKQSNLSGTYDYSNTSFPLITPTGAYSSASALPFSAATNTQEKSLGKDLGASVNYLMPMHLGEYPAAIKFGAKYRAEDKNYDDNIFGYLLNAGQNFTLANVLGTFTNASHYDGHYPINISPDWAVAENYIVSNPQMFTLDPATVLAAKLGTFSGSEKIVAGYVAYTVDVDRAHYLVGGRVEQTTTSYNANAMVAGSSTATQPVTGGRNYTNFFPNAQVRYEVDDQTNVRAAITTSMARPLYSQLSPSVTLTTGAQPTDANAITAGNPNLKPMTSVNEDFLIEHFMSGVGIVEVGVFAKQVSNYIFNSAFVYSGAPFDGYHGTQPQNLKTGSITGLEFAWSQRFTSLPDLLSGLGMDLNGTWTHSNGSTPTRPSIQLPQSSPLTGNLSATYALGPVSARATYQYADKFIHNVGDGSTNPSTGDEYSVAHTQIDASLSIAISPQIQFIASGLNLNNAPFGYYIGVPTAFKQREYYGRTVSGAFRFRF